MIKGALVLLALASPARGDDRDAPAPPRKPVDRMQQLEDELARLKDDNAALERRVDELGRVSVRLSGYLDVGLFATTGDGAGTRSDVGNLVFPEYAGIVPGSWVFMGDPLSTTVNARGEPADTGESRAVTFDPIDSRGKSTFLVNALNLGLLVGIGDAASLVGSVDFVPRGRDVSNPMGLFVGDYLDVKLAYAEWRPALEQVSLALQVGKFDSVLGREYRALESPDRTTVTPSLICRYICGRPIGVKARAKALDDALIL
ncbi:MAG TPA: bZIP transcription factor, partial [Kofleriaceae bacterium]|nr:bZIP transcription factor [Kofleriaceae bacterium]